MNWWKRRKLLRQEKKELIKVIEGLGKKLNDALKFNVYKIREFDQDKVYYVCVEGASREEVEEYKEYLKMVKAGVNWNLPEFLVLNHELSELDSKLLKELLNKIKKKELIK